MIKGGNTITKICLGCIAQYEDEYNICPTCGYVEDTPVADSTHIEPGSKLQDRYIVGKSLGFGGFGVTYIGWDTLIERAIAIKEYLPSEFSTRTPGQTNITVYTGNKSEQFVSGLDRFIDEAQRLAKFTSIEGIVNIYDTFAENNTAYIIMELLHGETLEARLNRVCKISTNDALAILKPIIKSLKLVHERGIIHRDIAPDNIFMLNDGSAKLIDFGAARFISMLNDRSLTVIVKPGYSPEEQYQSKAIQGAYTDVYAIGATLYRMITGVVPPNALDRRASIESKQKDLLAPPSKYCDIRENAETAILNTLNVQIEDRTRDISTFHYELTTSDAVKRRYGQIKTSKRWPLWAKIGVPAVLSIIAVFTLLFATGIMPFNRSEIDTESLPEGITRVPSVINDNLGMAENRLFEAELLYSIVGKEFSSEIAMNYVLGQDINGGTLVEINTLLSLVVSGGIETRTMPSVKGAPLEEATSVLEYLEFDIQVEEQYSPVEEGVVILHDMPSDSELEVGSTVTLFVSEGADPSIIHEDEMVIVPDFVDMTYDDVLEEAEILGATLAVNTEYSPTVERDQIISQSIAADSEIMPGDTVDITVSLGVETVLVRDVQFRTAGEAVTILEEQGLKIALVYESSDTVANNVVINQMPAANMLVEPGAEVTIIVSWDTDIASPVPTAPPSSEDPNYEVLEAYFEFLRERTFELYTTDPRFFSHASYAIVDIDGDGYPELVVMREHSHATKFFLIFEYDLIRGEVVFITTRTGGVGSGLRYSSQRRAIVFTDAMGMDRVDFYTLNDLKLDTRSSTLSLINIQGALTREENGVERSISSEEFQNYIDELTEIELLDVSLLGQAGENISANQDYYHGVLEDFLSNYLPFFTSPSMTDGGVELEGWHRFLRIYDDRPFDYGIDYAFYDPVTGNRVRANDVPFMSGDEEWTTIASRFELYDIDGDGIPEVLIYWVGSLIGSGDGGYSITVYRYVDGSYEYVGDFWGPMNLYRDRNGQPIIYWLSWFGFIGADYIVFDENRMDFVPIIERLDFGHFYNHITNQRVVPDDDIVQRRGTRTETIPGMPAEVLTLIEPLTELQESITETLTQRLRADGIVE